MRYKHFFLSDPLFDELDDLGWMLGGRYPLYVQILKRVIYRLDLNLVEFGDDLFPVN